MRILKVDKDKVQVELTAEEVRHIEGGLFLANSYEIMAKNVEEPPKQDSVISLFNEWRTLRQNMTEK